MDASILTTGQVAKLCHVSNRSVTKWIDEGLLKGYKLPGSDHRRVQRVDLVAFMREHQMPMDEIEAEAKGK